MKVLKKRAFKLNIFFIIIRTFGSVASENTATNKYLYPSRLYSRRQTAQKPIELRLVFYIPSSIHLIRHKPIVNKYLILLKVGPYSRFAFAVAIYKYSRNIHVTCKANKLLSRKYNLELIFKTKLNIMIFTNFNLVAIKLLNINILVIKNIIAKYLID